MLHIVKILETYIVNYTKYFMNTIIINYSKKYFDFYKYTSIYQNRNVYSKYLQKKYFYRFNHH